MKSSEILEPAYLNEYKGILGDDISWYCIDRDAGIWFTCSLPGRENICEETLTKLYHKFPMYICLGKVKKNHYAVTHMVDMIGLKLEFAEGEDGTMYFYLQKHEKIHVRRFIGIIMCECYRAITNVSINRMIQCSKKKPFVIDGFLFKNPHHYLITSNVLFRYTSSISNKQTIDSFS